MLRDVFYYGQKPNVHPREKLAKSLSDAKRQATTEHFWIINEFCDYSNFDWDFDFEFLPNEEVWTENHINVWPSQHQKDSGTWLVNTNNLNPSIVYRRDVNPVRRKNIKHSYWKIVQPIDENKFDFSWHPDPTDPPYIYIFPTQWNSVGGPEYHVLNAHEEKYINTQLGITVVDFDKWNIPKNIDTTDFDFSWVPHPKDPPFIYQFGTQWQKTGGPSYIVEGASDIKYIELQKVIALPTTNNWVVPNNLNITNFDFSWHPDNTDMPYIYQFGTQWALSGGPKYIIEGAKEIKYMDDMIATVLPDKANWEIPESIDIENFDYSWHPYVEDQPYIYQFGTQHQKTGGPRYITPGALPTSPTKYIDTRILKAKRLPNCKNFVIRNNYKIKDFDWSWHPDDTDEPYIYVFGNNQYSAEIMPTIEYAMVGAKQIKYISSIIAVLDDDRTNWIIPENIDTTDFDFSWKPNPKDPPYIYEFGTQWQKTGGPRYVVDDATQVKYIEGSKAKSLPNKQNWILPIDIPIIDFDYSWHPDSTDSPYIYVFGTQWQSTAGPRYVVEGATEYKYIDVNFAKAGPTNKNWSVPSNVVITDFDYSWHPHPDDPIYIYEFGTQWHDRGGPVYTATGANKDTPIKYIDTLVIKAILGPTTDNWYIPEGITIGDFDYSWVPHPNDPPYIYVWGNKYVSNIYKSTIEYRVPYATQIKYMTNDVDVLPEWDRWYIPNNIDKATFDFSWRPDPLEPDLVWQFGTQWQETGGPRYITSNATEIKYVDRNIMQSFRVADKKNWEIPNNINVSNFDFSWHPDDRADPYIYQFGTLLDRNDGPRYITSGNKGEIVYLPRVEIVNNTFSEIQPTGNNIVVNSYYIETTLDELVKLHVGEVFWALNRGINYDKFNFDWRPDSIKDIEYIQVFGSPDSTATHTSIRE